MAKEKYFRVRNRDGDDITFHKEENGRITVHQGYSEVEYTVKECREIIEKLKQCIKS